MSDFRIAKDSLAGKIARRLAMFDKYEWQLHPSMAQGRKQSRYELRAVELVGLISEFMEKDDK